MLSSSSETTASVTELRGNSGPGLLDRPFKTIVSSSTEQKYIVGQKASELSASNHVSSSVKGPFSFFPKQFYNLKNLLTRRYSLISILLLLAILFCYFVAACRSMWHFFFYIISSEKEYSTFRETFNHNLRFPSDDTLPHKLATSFRMTTHFW